MEEDKKKKKLICERLLEVLLDFFQRQRGDVLVFEGFFRFLNLFGPQNESEFAFIMNGAAVCVFDVDGGFAQNLGYL